MTMYTGVYFFPDTVYCGVTRADVDAERSRLLASMSATRHSSSARYGGAVPCR